MFLRKRNSENYKKTHDQVHEAEYIELKNELNNYIKVRNTLNTFMISTFIAIIALVYNNKPEPLLFLFAQFLTIPVLIRLVDYKRTEARLAAYIIDNFKDKFPCGVGWESKRYDRRWYFFEFLALSGCITLYFLIVGVRNCFSTCESIVYLIVSVTFTVLISCLTKKGNGNTLEKIRKI